MCQYKNFFRHNSSQYQTYFLMVLTHYADSGVITFKKFYIIGHRARAAGLEEAAMSIMTGQGKDLIKGHLFYPF